MELHLFIIILQIIIYLNLINHQNYYTTLIKNKLYIDMIKSFLIIIKISIITVTFNNPLDISISYSCTHD